MLEVRTTTFYHPLFGLIKPPKLPPTSQKTLTLVAQKIETLNLFLTKNGLGLSLDQISHINEASKYGLNRKNFETVLGKICTYSLTPPQREFLDQIEISDWKTEERQTAVLDHVVERLKLDSIFLEPDEITSLQTYIREMKPPTNSTELHEAYDNMMKHGTYLITSGCSPYKAPDEDYHLVTWRDV
jgi:hypothetical protein